MDTHIPATKSNTKCICFDSNFSNMEILALNNEAHSDLPEVGLFSNSHKESTSANSVTQERASDTRRKQIYMVKFNYESETQFCKQCTTIHSTRAKKLPHSRTTPSSNFIERVNHAALFRLNPAPSSLKKSDKNSEFKQLYAELKQKLDRVDTLLDNFSDFSKNYELRVAKQCETIRNKILHAIDTQLVAELSENRSKLMRELDSYEQRCIKHVDTESHVWSEFNTFVDSHVIDCRTIDYFLSQGSDEPTLVDEINAFKLQIEDTKAKFDAYIHMDRHVAFTAQISTRYIITQYNYY